MDSISKRRRGHSEGVSVEGNEDRLSNLPTSLIGHILSFLPTKNAVATSVLSTKWKYLWTLVTTLDFDDGLVCVSATPRKSNKQRQSLVETSFINFVYRVLSRNVSDLQKFRLRCTRSYDVSHVNAWVSTALSRNLRELHLSHIGSLPRELFSCSSLVVLELAGILGHTIVLSVPTLVCLLSLKILIIDSLKFGDDDSFHRLFSSCPVLEDLSIKRCDLTNISVFNISSPNLKTLAINYQTLLRGSSNYKIVLNTPNLRDLKYHDYVAEGYSGNKLNALVKADISFVKRFPHTFTERLAIAEFVERIPKVQWLHLSNHSIETFQFCWFRLLTYLELGSNDQCVEWKLLLNFVKCSPQLETLIIWGLPPKDGEENQTTSSWYQPPIVPCCLLYHLKKIEIKRFKGKGCELKMAEYFLMNSKVLQKLMIHPRRRQELEICKKLLMLPRGYNTCQVEVL